MFCILNVLNYILMFAIFQVKCVLKFWEWVSRGYLGFIVYGEGVVLMLALEIEVFVVILGQSDQVEYFRFVQNFFDFKIYSFDCWEYF